MDIEPGELTVGQLSQRSGVAISALHFYERQGLILSRRTSGNQRRYKRDTLRRVALVGSPSGSAYRWPRSPRS